MAIVMTRNWWALLLRGALAVLFGLIALVIPGAALGALILLFAVYALLDGIGAIIAAVKSAERHERWIPMLIEGIAGVLAGVLTFIWPGATALVLLYLIGFWAIVTGVLKIVAAVHLRRVVPGEWVLILNGIFTVLFGILVVALPTLGLLTLIWWIGFYAILRGVLYIALAFRLRRRSS
jgi:uncharacterized membrane protein HdeD (DUF308 family)